MISTMPMMLQCEDADLTITDAALLAEEAAAQDAVQPHEAALPLQAALPQPVQAVAGGSGLTAVENAVGAAVATVGTRVPPTPL